MQNKRKLNAQEVAIMVGVSVPTLTSWYKWKKEFGENHPMAQWLPDYQQENPRQARYWNRDDVWKLIQFKVNIPQGRNGIMGKVTQKYVKKEEVANV